MKIIWRNTLAACIASLTLIPAAAQQSGTKEKTEKKKKNVTVITNNGNEEKLIVEVDGDKVTINGKPAEEYHGEGVQIITSDGRFTFSHPPRAMAVPGVPAPPARAFTWNSNKAVLGVSLENGTGGAKVTRVDKESAAEKAGLKEGDIITKINDQSIANAGALTDAIGKFKPDDKITIHYQRDGKSATATATLQKNRMVFASTMPTEFDLDFDFNSDSPSSFFYSTKPRMGVQIEDVAEGSGVKVLEVTPETPAAKSGLQKDDIITSFTGKEIKSVDDLRAAMRDVKQGESVALSYKRGNNTRSTSVVFPKPVKKARL